MNISAADMAELDSLNADLVDECDRVNDRLVEIDMETLAKKYPRMTPVQIRDAIETGAISAREYAAYRMIRYVAVFDYLIKEVTEHLARTVLYELAWSDDQIDEAVIENQKAERPDRMMRHILALFTVCD